jgi:hypothetical protein
MKPFRRSLALVAMVPIALALASRVLGSCPDARFARQVVVPAGGAVEGIAVADFNEDGSLDMAATNFSSGGPNSNGVSILLGDGNGGFGTPTRFDVGRGATRIAASELNGDGKTDLAVLNTNDGTVSILLGDGHGRFGPQSAFTTGGTAIGLALGDFNGDEATDLAVTEFLADRISVLLGAGDGSFSTPTPFPVAGQPLLIAAGDFNGDGEIDLAVDRSIDAKVSILLSNGNGTFNAGPEVPLPAGAFGESLALSDLDGDLDLDMAVNNAQDDTVVVYLGHGDGSFGGPAAFPVGGFPVFLAVGDLNNDGRPDLAVAGADGTTVSVLLGRGDGTFQPQAVFGVGTEPIPVELGDFNGDGVLDIVAGNIVDQTISLLINECSRNRPPVASAGPDQVVECTGERRAVVRLDASASTDPDSTPGTNDDIASFAWSQQGAPLASGQTASIALPLGAHVVALTVMDEAGEESSDTVTIDVEDTTVPTITSIEADPATISPSNHGLVPVAINVVAEDRCDPSPSCKIVSVTSSKPAPGSARGIARPNVFISDRGPKTSPARLGVLLRADRSGPGPGQTYTINVSCEDAAGNASLGQTTVTVAKKGVAP